MDLTDRQTDRQTDTGVFQATVPATFFTVSLLSVYITSPTLASYEIASNEKSVE
jgi:hypothetical protein